MLPISRGIQGCNGDAWQYLGRNAGISEGAEWRRQSLVNYCLQYLVIRAFKGPDDRC
jgi:hypothetical protein